MREEVAVQTSSHPLAHENEEEDVGMVPLQAHDDANEVETLPPYTLKEAKLVVDRLYELCTLTSMKFKLQDVAMFEICVGMQKYCERLYSRWPSQLAQSKLPSHHYFPIIEVDVGKHSPLLNVFLRIYHDSKK